MRKSIPIFIPPSAYEEIHKNYAKLDNLIVEAVGKAPMLLNLQKGEPVSDMTMAWEKLKHQIFLALEEGQECGYDSPESKDYGKFVTYQYIYDLMKKLESKGGSV